LRFARRFACIVIAVLGGMVVGKAQDYSFNGVLADLFTPAFAEGAYTFEQECGRMVAHNSGVRGPSAFRGYFLKDTKPTRDQSWTLSARLTIPLAVDAPGGAPGAEEYAEVGIGCLVNGHNFVGGLEVHPQQQADPRRVVCETSINGEEVFDGEGRLPTTEESVTVSIRYDHVTRVLRFYAGGIMLFDLDIAADGQNHVSRAVDWGMTAGSQFQIAVFANSENFPVFAETPLQLDDFSFHLDGDPGPGGPTLTINTQAINLEFTGEVGRRYEIQRSCDARTWSTLFSVFGTGGLTRVPLTADTGQALYRVRE